MANKDMLIRVQADTKNYDANLAKASRTLSNFAKDNLTASGAIKQTTTALTGLAAQYMGAYAAIRGAQKAMSDMVRINMQFEQGTANLASIIGKSTSEITALTTQAKNLGATTRYTAMQITELQTNLARLGFTQQEILNSTTAVQALATATGADLGEAANLAGAALRGFGLNASEMERVASVLSVSTTKSALSFEKLATAVPIVAPVAKQFGFTIEDTVTLLAKLSDAGMDASSAATATRNIFLKMANDSGKLATALGRPVHSVEEFGEALAEMRNKGMSLSDILSMVGVRSTAAFAVFADNAETLKDFKQSITDCSDAMHDMEAKQIDTLQGSLIILNSAWEGLMLSFNESTGPIKKAVDALTELLQAWTKWRNRNQGGDAAIQSYELSEEDVKKKGAEILKGYREATNGRTGQKLYGSDEDILQKITNENEALSKQIEELKKLEALYKEYYDWLRKADWHNPATNKKNEKYLAKFKAYGYGGGDESRTQLQKDIAAKNDRVHINDYLIAALTPAPIQRPTTGGGQGGGGSETGKQYLARRKAEIEAEIQMNISKLDRMTMDEEDYEAKVYEIKRSGLQQIADLYEAETAEKAHALAAIARLDIQYQGIQMRLANRSNKGSAEPEEVYMGGREMTQIEKMRQQMAIQKADQAATLDDTTFKNLMGTVIQKGIDGLDLNFEVLFQKMFEGENIPDEAWQSLVDEINAKLEEMNLPPIKLDVKTGGVEELQKEVAQTTDHVAGAAAAFSALGDAMSQIDDPGAKVAGMIAEAIGSVAAGYGAATAQAATLGPWAWITFAVTGLATMISTIAGIKQATAGSYAEGGIVPGNNYNDGLVANVSSGELILNRAQQDSIAGQLSAGNPLSNLQLTTRLSGTELLILLNNTNRSMGGSRSFYTERH